MRQLRPTDRPSPPARLAHYVLRCRSFAETKEWYLKVLNAHVQFENEFLAFITYDGLGDLLSTYRRLKADGIVPYWCINHGPTTSMYYRDPESNQIELQIDNYEKVEDLNAWMRGTAFSENPLGVEFDPERLIARFESGDPLEELVRQGSAPKS